MKDLRNIFEFINKDNIYNKEEKSYENLVHCGLCSNLLSTFVLFLAAWLAFPFFSKLPEHASLHSKEVKVKKDLGLEVEENDSSQASNIFPCLYFFEYIDKIVVVVGFKATSMKLPNTQLL